MLIWRRSASPKWCEANEAALHALAPGRVAIVERPGQARALVEVTCRTRAQAAKLKRCFGGKVLTLPADWWQKLARANQPRPLRVGRRLVVLPAPDSRRVNASERTLVIPAAMAFGSGEHPTTAMCLRILERMSRERTAPWRLLDLGTGTGILGLAGKCLGAAAVLAIDYDRHAIAAAKANARANRIRGVRIERRDLTRWAPDGEWDAITANLFSELLIAALPKLARALAATGCLILSGVLREQEAGVVRALRSSQLEPVEFRRRGKWIALRAHPRQIRG